MDRTDTQVRRLTRVEPSAVLHVVMNGFTNDSRVLKETASIGDSYPKMDIWIAALKDPGTKEVERLGRNRWVWRVPLRSRLLPKGLVAQGVKYLEWLARIVIRFASAPIAVVHCHDLSALPIGVVLRALRGVSLIYDAHELQTERHNIQGVRRRLSKVVERLLIHTADDYITMSPSIARDYEQRYRIPRPTLVRNIPHLDERGPGNRSLLRSKIGVADDEVLYIYQGGLIRGRGIGHLVEAFRDLEEGPHIVFMGNGPLSNLVREAAAHSGRIHYIPAVPPADVLRHTRGADVGMSLNEGTSLNYKYSLPNKLFEYIKAGLPVIVNNLPDQRALVSKYGCGWIVDVDKEPASLSALIRTLSIADIASRRERAQIASGDLTWETEADQMLTIYDRFLPAAWKRASDGTHNAAAAIECLEGS